VSGSDRSSRFSLRTRLIWGALVWVIGALTGAGALSSELLRRQHLADYRAALELELESLTRTLRFDSQGVVETSWRPADSKLPGLAWAVVASDGSPALQGGAAAPLPAAMRPGELRLFERTERDGWAALARTWRPPEVREAFAVVAVARLASLDPDHLTRHGFWTLSLGGAALLLLGAGAITLRRGLAPLGALEQRLTAVRRGDARRLEGHFPSEIDGVVSELNALLERSEENVEQARAEAAALAHALKTPLAVLEGEIERVEEAGHAELAARLAVQLAQLRDQVEWRLARARIAERARDPNAQCDASAVLERLVETLRRLHGVAIRFDAPPRVVVRCDRADLEEIAGNLIDNACKWASERVGVTLVGASDEATVTVDDDGPGLDPDRRALVFERGRRLDASTPGSGFGLAIARELAEAYGGRIELATAPAGGLRASLVLPLPSQPRGD